MTRSGHALGLTGVGRLGRGGCVRVEWGVGGQAGTGRAWREGVWRQAGLAARTAQQGRTASGGRRLAGNSGGQCAPTSITARCCSLARCSACTTSQEHLLSSMSVPICSRGAKEGGPTAKGRAKRAGVRRCRHRGGGGKGRCSPAAAAHAPRASMRPHPQTPQPPTRPPHLADDLRVAIAVQVVVLDLEERKEGRKEE